MLMCKMIMRSCLESYLFDFGWDDCALRSSLCASSSLSPPAAESVCPNRFLRALAAFVGDLTGIRMWIRYILCVMNNRSNMINSYLVMGCIVTKHRTICGCVPVCIIFGDVVVCCNGRWWSL